MKQFIYVINDPIGVHARPATIFVKEAKKFESEITLSANGKKANATSMLMIMSMAIKQGNEVTVTASGSDEEAAIAKFRELFKDNL